MILFKDAYVVVVGKYTTNKTEQEESVKIARSLGVMISENESSILITFKSSSLLEIYRERLEAAGIEPFAFSLKDSAKEKLK
jgi:Rad3-related DNA helicase